MEKLINKLKNISEDTKELDEEIHKQLLNIGWEI